MRTMIPVSEMLKYLSSYFMMKTGIDKAERDINNRLSFLKQHFITKVTVVILSMCRKYRYSKTTINISSK